MVSTVELSHGAFQGIKSSDGAIVSHTGDTVEFTLATVTIPGGSMGPKGILRVTSDWKVQASNGNTKTYRWRLGGPSGTEFFSSVQTAVQSLRDVRWVYNMNAQNSQLGSYPAAAPISGSSASQPITSAVDMSVDQDIVFSGQLGNSSDTISLLGWMVEVFYKA